MPDLLFEVGVEEIPAGYLRPALAELKQRAEAALREAGLQFRAVLTTATPRRLTLSVQELPIAQAAREEEVLGPSEQAAMKDGKPTRAAEGFAQKLGVPASELYVKETAKGRYVAGKKRTGGRPTGEILLELLPGLITGLAWPKSMRWPQGAAPAAKDAKQAKAPTFARPIRRVLCMLGNQVLPVELFGLRAQRNTIGHPYLVGERMIALERADYPAYRALLKGHGVVVDRNERRGIIQGDLDALFARHQATLRHPELVEEVTDLVEQPEVLEGRFPERYLELPPAIIAQAMTEHQRYFPIFREDGSLEPSFAFVADRPQRTAPLILEGNERVLRARLEDAMFYLHEDQKVPLAEREERQRRITHHEKLGTVLDRTRRLERLTAKVCELCRLGPAEAATAARAAALAKADLTTDLVAEFPRLQGEVGAEYARRQGEPEQVARAIREHYLPRFASDALPESPAGIALALADRLDHLACFYAAGFAPSGNADPMALRRTAIAIVRLVGERDLDLSLRQALGAAVDAVPAGLMPRAELLAALATFLEERFAAFLREQREHRYDLVDAVLAARPLDDFQEVQRRVAALAELSRRADFPSLCELVERTYNISKPLDDPAEALPRIAAREELLQAPEEKALWAAWHAARPRFVERIALGAFVEAAGVYLEALKVPVHAFFDGVFVNVEDRDVRLNRLCLCRELHDAFARSFADLRKVVIAKAEQA